MKPGINWGWIQREVLGGGGGGGGACSDSNLPWIQINQCMILIPRTKGSLPPQSIINNPQTVILFLGGKRGSYRVMIN